ncbi:Acetoacetate decarboxylase (ADC) [Parafrankia irregularis]|uniref:Acetoacetate decarboxylase (ADC) n=1 Tax=Parafrankia irregularis TaxID=795642 RepID=A0A0S4QLC9_9ACTN|nr:MULTISPECIES: acetoacetate decarboxylase family protein [Parafrankia]MBE3202346.1 acetoacetate decarboxylase family protein [Parafrankia sp. CH37]CUU56100.1 Acetoacetate decarboxylase (ADC) [Parafrankia irregularis]
MAATHLWGTIDGTEITFPMRVEEFNAATLTYSVPARQAAALLPGSSFELVETAPGVGCLVIAACDFRRNPWGDYNELNVGFLSRPAGAGDETVGSFIYRMPVNQPFTCEAGNMVMGFPKTVETISAGYDGGGFTFRVSSPAGLPALTLGFPRRPAPLGPPVVLTVESYSYLDGHPYATAAEMEIGSDAVDPSEVSLELGEGPLADELRGLGLPVAPDSCVWGEGLRATFQLGRRLVTA